MQLRELRQSSAFSAPKERSAEYTAQVAVINMKFYAKKIVSNFENYERVDPSSEMAEVFTDAIQCNLNNYVQTFIDAVSALCNTPVHSLRGLIQAFITEFELHDDMLSWVKFLIRRNDLIHDYLGLDFLLTEMRNSIAAYKDCILVLPDFIEENLASKQALNVKVHKR